MSVEGSEGDADGSYGEAGGTDDSAERAAGPAIDPATTSALLWGVVGALTFGVLYQGYVLTGAAFDARVLAGGAVLVGVVTAVAVRLLEPRLVARRA